MSLSWIPKGILEKLTRISFWFLWYERLDKQSLAWVKWKTLAIRKCLDGLGLKFIFHFSKALSAKSIQRLIQGKNMV